MNRKYLILVAIVAAVLLCHPAPGLASILDSAESFAVLAGSTVTNTGPTVITGNLGLSPGTSVTNFPPGTVAAGYAIHINDALADQAKLDLTKAYLGLAAMPFTTHYVIPTELGGKTLTSGVYKFDSSAGLTGTLTLDAQGNNDAYWVFQIGSTLITATNSLVDVINLGPNGGIGNGVFWQVGASATLGTYSTFEGNILALASITVTTGATIPNGRALAQTGAVTLDDNDISIVCPDGGPGFSGGLKYDVDGTTVVPLPEPCTILLLGSGLAGLFAARRRSRSAA
jgi:hypothetical protein